MARASEWLEGARLRTLPASIAPVLAGTGCAWFIPVGDGTVSWGRRLVVLGLCLVVGLGLQIGSNFANDYSDGVRGTDDHRVGPMRLVGSGAATPASVKRAAIMSFAIAGVAGLILVAPFIIAAWSSSNVVPPLILLVVGLSCVWAAWFYTGGKHPYGYAGLGEVFVFVFFGLVATLGTAFVQAPPICADCSGLGCHACGPGTPWLAAVITAVMMGCLAVAILVANNLRDLESDKASGKVTLPVRLGDRATRRFYLWLVVGSAVCVVILAAVTGWVTLIALAGPLLCVPSLRRVLAGARGGELIMVLKHTGLAELATAGLVFVALWLSTGPLMGVVHP